MKKLVVLVLVLLAAGGGIAYYIYHKPHDTVEQHKGTRIDAHSLTEAFSANEEQATRFYLNKVLIVKGRPAEITKNDDGYPVVFFSEDGLYGVQATLRDTQLLIGPDSIITLRGFCNGYTTVVLLSDCVTEP